MFGHVANNGDKGKCSPAFLNTKTDRIFSQQGWSAENTRITKNSTRQ